MKLSADPTSARSSGFRVGRESRVEVETSAAEEDGGAEVREATEAERSFLDHLDGRAALSRSLASESISAISHCVSSISCCRHENAVHPIVQSA